MQLGWIDFSTEDRNKVLDVIHLFQKSEAVDELGIGIIRDAFADYFFPGTSTIQTRAKYFLIVSYVLKEAGDGKYGSDIAKMIRAIDDQEWKCGIKLMEGNQDGIIGKNNLPKSWVVRTPSDIYWSGIKRFGIFADAGLSIRDFLKESVALRNMRNHRDLGNRADGAEENERDDKDAGDVAHFRFWNLPDVCNRNWRENLTIDLLPEEAAFLHAQIVKSQKTSLLGFLLEHNMPIQKYTGFEALSLGIYQDVSEDMRVMLNLANAFNRLVYLSRIRYNLVLSGGENVTARKEWDFYEMQIEQMADVDLEAIYERLGIRNFYLKKFLNELKAAFLAKDYEKADEIIKRREIKLKGPGRAKLNRIGERKDDNWVGGGWLDYRFHAAKRIIADIYAGEGIEDV